MSRLPRMVDTLCRRLYCRVVIDPVTGCWNWQGAKIKGYGVIQRVLGEKPWGYTHRVSYEMWYGKVPRGFELHHQCVNRVCCNPEHLQRVTRKDHLADLSPRNFGYANKRKTHCPKGHPLKAGNLDRTLLARGVRCCRTCKNQRQRTPEQAAYHKAYLVAWRRKRGVKPKNFKVPRPHLLP